MNHPEAREWAKDFENKGKSELLAMPFPEGLDAAAMEAWWLARSDAIEVLEEVEDAAQAESGDIAAASPAADEPPAGPAERTRLPPDEMHNAELRAKARADEAQVPLALPDGDAALLLEKQIASSAALIGYLSNYVARKDTDPSVCMSFMDRMTAMLGASANVGKVVGRLRGQVSRTEQFINVNRMEGERGRG
ncbi:MAG: hypothetical protein JSR55_05390 [Proteobacteria bacterium]|nr:hypothetical protein [Pseudomonadota bacterium]